MRIDVMRHGECEGGKIFRGSTNSPLTPLGREQMQASLKTFSGAWAGVVSSPLLRCQSFATTLSVELSLPLMLVDGFQEMGFGDWEGQEVQDVWDKDEWLLQQWSRDPDKVTPPRAERFAAFKARVSQALGHLESKHADSHLLLVTHGGVIKLLLMLARGEAASAMKSYTIPHGFTATFELRDGIISILYPHESAYVFSG